LSGAANPASGVDLLLFVDRPEDVIFALLDQHIPWEEAQRTLRYADGERVVHPVLRFVAGDIPVELLVLPRRALRHPPLDPVTERPYRGANRAEVVHLLQSDIPTDS
jgi:hypothetical protein